MSGHPWPCLHIWKCISNSLLETPVHGQGLSLAGLHWESDELINLPIGTRGDSTTPDMHLPIFPLGLLQGCIHPRGCLEQGGVHLLVCWCSGTWTDVKAEMGAHCSIACRLSLNSLFWALWFISAFDYTGIVKNGAGPAQFLHRVDLLFLCVWVWMVMAVEISEWYPSRGVQGEVLLLAICPVPTLWL